jgi:GNAT superfamily N-acetyltransferase
MWPRLPRGGKLWEESKGEKNRRAFRKLVTAGKVHAVIAFAGDEPVGWCSFGPRQSFPRLDRIRAIQHDWSPGTWSVVCFYVAARWRRSGVSTRLLEAATREALAQGATSIEGYPTDSKTGVVSASFAWMGLPGIFRANGYEETKRPTSSKRVYVKRGEPGNSDCRPLLRWQEGY